MWIMKDFGVGVATSSAVGAKRLPQHDLQPRLDWISGEGTGTGPTEARAAICFSLMLQGGIRETVII
jgi:hypothetical protein